MHHFISCIVVVDAGYSLPLHMGTQTTKICAVLFFCVLICSSTDFSCCMLLVYYLSVIVCFPIMQDSIY